MPKLSVARHVEILEQKVDILESLPGRVTALEDQIVLLRSEMRGSFSALRDELRADIRAGDEETRRDLRVRHEEVMSPLALIEEEIAGPAEAAP